MDNSVTYTNASNDKCTIKFISKCYNCSHGEVCGYKDEYGKLIEGVEKAFNDQSYNKMFSISVECKYYKDDTSNMINCKGYEIPCINNKPMLDPNKITITCDDINTKTYLNDNNTHLWRNSDTNKINLESK